MTRVVFILLLSLNVLPAHGQTSAVTGRITYISSGAVYTSLGKDAGVIDSSKVSVVSGNDTIAVLKVFATSSKSSVCRIINQKSQIKIGNVVTSIPLRFETKIPVISDQSGEKINDTASIPLSTKTVLVDSTHSSTQSWFSLRGSIGMQYQGTTSSAVNSKYSQSGGFINISGKFTGIPIGFEFYGNLRYLFKGDLGPFTSKGINRSRIYRVSLSFYDGTNLISVGRIIPAYSLGIGYVDGLMALRSFNGWTFGFVAGLEPGYTQRTFSSNLKKAGIFGSYTANNIYRPSLNISYARTYYGSLLNRESLSGSFRIFPFERLSISAQCDMDLRMKSENEYPLSPKPTLFYANVDYRFPSTVAIGAGLSMWRPSYSFVSIRTIADSLLDVRIRTTPNLNIHLTLPYGISIYNNYSPRVTAGQFGKEYLNYTSLTFSDILNYGFTTRFSVSLNSTEFSTSRNYGLSVQKNILNILDASIRYQENRNTISQTGELLKHTSFSLDVFTCLFTSITLLGSVERFVGYGSNGYAFIAEIRKKF